MALEQLLVYLLTQLVIESTKALNIEFTFDFINCFTN